MRPRTPTLRTSRRSSDLTVDARTAWERLVDAGPGAHWWRDAPPLVFRAGLDRLVGGDGAPHRPAGAALETGDLAGFWRVERAQPPGSPTPDAPGVLHLVARVRAPGRVDLISTVSPAATGGCRLAQEVRFTPAGPAGTAYLLADLPAREVVCHWVHRRTRHELRA